jgi:glycolate oxidase FAD binding subunit
VTTRLQDHVADLARVVGDAYRRGEAIVALGRGRHWDVGGTLRRRDLLARLVDLDRVRAHDPADMTVTVEAGCTIAALQDALGAAGQWLPIDPPCPEETTVGGLIAANLSGPLRASQGTVRDLLLGLTVIGADGVVIRGGGRVVKNVAGYDLPKMHVGALGTLGVIVEATFKVRPRFRAEQAVLLRVPRLAEACTLALRVRDLVEPTWLEIVHPGSLMGADDAETWVVAGMGGAPAWVEEAVAAVLAMHAHDMKTYCDGGALRQAIANLAVRPAAAVVRAATLPADVPGFVPTACAELARAGLAIDVTVHAVTGVARFAVARADDVGRVLERLRAAAPAYAVVLVERAAEAVKVGLDVWGGFGDGAPLMARLKRACDPAGLFAPGRLEVV